MLSQKIVKKIHDWKPISEFFTGILGVLVSCLALVISLYALRIFFITRMTAHPGRHFGIAISEGTTFKTGIFRILITPPTSAG